MSTKLSAKSVGSSVYLNVNGTKKEFIVVHQGLPSSQYDSSCNGTWLLMKEIYVKKVWREFNNDYENSDVRSYLEGTFFGLLDSNIQAAVKRVKIPYHRGAGADYSAYTGANGLSSKIFLLSGWECGYVTISGIDLYDGSTKLSYFDSGSASAKDKRIAYYNGSAANWWLRSPKLNNNYSVGFVNASGSIYINEGSKIHGVRPALVLDSSLSVSDDGSVQTNSAPTITCSSASGSNLGTKSSGFSISYSVSDADGDSVTVTEKMDGTTKRTFTATDGATNSFAVTDEYFQKLLNGEHTMEITATDGTETVTHTLTFTKLVTAAVISLAEPMAADAQITVCTIAATGDIPDDAEYTVEVTNNANDTEPVWEDCTSASKSNRNYLFTNETAVNGFAFNFRVTAKRGSSGTAGYISSIQGGFQ